MSPPTWCNGNGTEPALAARDAQAPRHTPRALAEMFPSDERDRRGTPVVPDVWTNSAASTPPPPSPARRSPTPRSPAPPRQDATQARADRPARQQRPQGDTRAAPPRNRARAASARATRAERDADRARAREQLGVRERALGRVDSDDIGPQRGGALEPRLHDPRLARLIRRELDGSRRLRGHPLRTLRRRDREDHDQPPGGPQRLPPRDADRGLGRPRTRRARTRASA